MTEFEYLSIGVGLILGLGVTMLLTSFLALFIARRNVRFDWIPIVWAFYILVIQIQYYSAMWNLNDKTVWTTLDFSLPLLLASLIFLAAGLVLPSIHREYPPDLGVYFERDGKWAVVALIARGSVAIISNSFVMGVTRGFSVVDGFILAQIVAAIFFLCSKKRKFKVTFTLLYGLILMRTILTIYL